MSVQRKPINYVREAAADDVVVHAEDPGAVEILKRLGFSEVSDATFASAFGSDEAKAEVLGKLRDCEVAFSAGAGWSPSEVFEELRDRHLIQGQYKRISWTRPGEFQIDDR
jgi:hypothetical protein